MKFVIALVSYLESLGYDTSSLRKSADGSKAIVHMQYAEILSKNLDTNANVTIYDRVNPDFQALLASDEWNGNVTGTPNSFGDLAELAKYEARLTAQVTEAKTDMDNFQTEIAGEVTTAKEDLNTIVDNYQVTVNQQLAEALKGKEGTNLKVIAGTVRNDGTGWKFIVDASHQADLNCDSVSADNAHVHINYASIDATKVVSFMVSPDESFAALGYFCGASVGVEQSSIKLYKSVPKSVGCVATCTSSGFTVNPDNIGITSLVWDSFKFKLRINHANLGSAYSTGGAPVILPYVTGKFIPRTVGINPLYTDIEFYNFSGTRIQALSDVLSFSFTRTTPEENTTKLIDPTTIINASASLWFVGIFEVA